MCASRGPMSETESRNRDCGYSFFKRRLETARRYRGTDTRARARTSQFHSFYTGTTITAGRTIRAAGVARQTVTAAVAHRNFRCCSEARKQCTRK